MRVQRGEEFGTWFRSMMCATKPAGDHHGVQRVAVIPQGLVDIAILGGVVHRGVEHPVELEDPRFLVVLVLVVGAGADLDDPVST